MTRILTAIDFKDGNVVRWVEGAATGLSRLIAAAVQPCYKRRATGSPFESKDKLKGRGYRWNADARVWFCNLGSGDALNTELAWLKAEAYGERQAQVEVELLDVLTRYSPRSGEIQSRGLPKT